MNKSLFKVLLVLGIIISMSLITAFSCGKVGDGGNNANNANNNNSGGGTGGGGNGGGGGTTVDGCKTGTTGTNICFESSDADVAQQTTDGTIQLKVSGFPQTAVSPNTTGTDIGVVKTAAAANFKKAFDLTIKVDGTAAKEGLVLVGPGSLANATNFSIGQAVAEGITDYDAALRKEGIVSEAATADANGLKAGWNILGSFMSDAAPTADADASPFAFTATTGAFATKPILFCRTTISTITGDAAVLATTKLTGGQTASCYIGVLGANFKDKAADDWLKSTTANFKKKFNIAVAGIKTDDKTIGGATSIGLPGDDTARIAAFKNGISTDDMTALTSTTAKNASAYKKFAVEVVAGTFMHTPPVEGTIVFENFDTDVAEQQTDGTIQLKASGFPTAAVSADIANTDVAAFKTAAAATFKRAFDITISAGGNNATGGLLLVGPGSLASTNDFSIGQGVINAITDYADRKEGIVSDTATGTATANGLFPAGWNIITPFMSVAAANADADASPFAFTATTGGNATKPVMFCKTTITTITTGAPAGTGSAQANTQLTGGQKASCYVSALGANFANLIAGNGWLNTAASANFKKKFNIAVAGIKTDTKTINDIGLPGAGDKSVAFRDGITQAEMAAIAAVNSSAYKKVAVEVVRGTLATYTTPAAGTIKLENFDNSIAALVGGVIQIKADGFPTGSVDANIASDINVVSGAGTANLKRAFDITIESSGNDATEGLILVGPGNLANANAFSIGQGVAQGLGTYSAALRKEGVVSDAARAAAHANGFLPAGWSIFGSFMNDTTPNAVGSDVSPISFTGFGGTQPIIVCKTTVSSVTSAASVTATTRLTGGETASCYVGAKGDAFVKWDANDWLNKAASATFKKRFDIAVAGVRTDGKTIAGANGMGLPGADDTAKVANFTDGISQAEIRELSLYNSTAYRKIPVEIVRSGFTYTPPALTYKFRNIDTDVRIDPNDSSVIQIKAQAFPAVSAAASLTATLGDLLAAPANSLKPIFDVVVSDTDDNDATGGFFLIGPGNWGGLLAWGTRFHGYSRDLISTAFEGYTSGRATNTAVGGGEVQSAGWNIYGVFMNNATPADNDPEVSPFAFTKTTTGNDSQPFVFCRSTMTAFTDEADRAPAGTFAGGERARCYIGSKGTAFNDATNPQAATWLATAASTTFKKRIRITFAAIRTDATPAVSTLIPADYMGWGGYADAHFITLRNNFRTLVKKFSVDIVANNAW